MSSYAIISDVHANFEALHAVLDNLEKESFDALLFLGDSVGYGPDPNECIDLLRAHTNIVLAGNHDWAVIGLTETGYFNPYAKAAIEWTIGVLTDKNKNFLKNLRLTETLEDDGIYLVHSTPKEPEQWHYLSHEYDARINFNYFEEKLCFVGHSHIPFIVEKTPSGKIRFLYDYVEIEDKNRYIINAGSVGQPRDGNPDAAYVLLKDNIIEIKRVSYNIVLTQEKMRKAGLPSYLIDRLSLGQ